MYGAADVSIAQPQFPSRAVSATSQPTDKVIPSLIEIYCRGVIGGRWRTDWRDIPPKDRGLPDLEESSLVHETIIDG